MQYFHSFFGIELNTGSIKFKRKIKKLKKLYDKIPATKCNFCPGKTSVEADCCKHFSPPMYLSEFLAISKEIESWPVEDRKSLLLACYRSYLNPHIVRPCPLLVGNDCSVYKSRPFSCRMYCQYPKEEWAQRLKTVSEDWDVPIKDIPMNEQCSEPNVSFSKKHTKPLTVKEENAIFRGIASLDIEVLAENFLVKNENNRDVAKDLVFESASTYMPFDAHYILMYSGADQLEKLTDIRLLLQQKNKDFKEGEIEKSELEELEQQVEEFIGALENSIGNLS